MAHELTGRFLKAKKDRPVGIAIQIGEFVEIQANGKGKTHNGSNWNCIPVQSDYFELMPKGFKPSSTVDRSSLKYPEKGEYFVTLQVESSSGTACAKNNFVFKQREDADFSKPVTDIRGSSGNSNSCISFDLKRDLKAWRFATKEEIAAYDRLGIPYDVTTLKASSVFKFEIGDIVCVTSRGRGHQDTSNRELTIVERGETAYCKGVGYRVEPPTGNALSSQYKGFNGEDSYTLIRKASKSMESTLEKAARLYPIGTVYIPLDTAGDPYSDEYRSERAPKALDLGIDVGYGYVYHYATAEWAEVVTKDATTTETEPVPSIHHGGFKVGDKVSCAGMSGVIVGFDTDISGNICVEAGKEPREARETNNGLYNELGEKLPTFMTIDRRWRTASSLTLISSVSSETKSEEKPSTEESVEYIECINSGKSYSSHSRAESLGCTRYARKSLTEGRIYKVIRKVQISDRTPGYSCTDGELDYLISENGTRRSTLSAYEAQNKLSQPAKNMTPSEKLGYKIGDLFRVVNSGNFSTGEIIRFGKDDGSICPRFTSVTSGRTAYKDLNSLERYVQEYWYFNDATITESEFADILESLTRNGYNFRKHAGFPLSFSSFKAGGYLRADDSFPMTFSIDNNSQSADVRKSRSDFGLSATPAVKHWIPEVGEHAVMLHAGGYGYHPDNNGCVALIKSVGTRSLGYGSKKRTVPSIGGTILNPKRSTDSVNFTNIPVHLENDKVICRKATSQEILAAQNVRRVPDLLVGHWYKYKGCYLKFDRITSENIVKSSEHINADGFHITTDVGWGTYDSIFQSLIVLMTFTDMEKVFEAFGIKDIHPTYRDLVPGVWYSSKNSYSSRSDCFKFHHMQGETQVFYSECVINDTWRNGMDDWGMVKDLYVTPKEHLHRFLPHDHPDLSTGTASSGNALSTLELLPMRVKI